MKIKPVYIYLILIFSALVLMVVLSDGSGEKGSENNIKSSSIPDDEIHKGMGESLTSQPSSSNVNNAIIDKMNELKKYVESNPSDTLKIREYADLLAAAHKQDEAIKLYNRIIDADPKRLDIHSYLAVLYYNNEKYLEAKEAVAIILSANPNNPEAIYNMGLIEARIGDIEAAKKQWQDLITNHPNSKMSDLAKEAIENL